MNTIAQTVREEGQEADAPAASSLCENCLTRAKSTELDEDGTTITHPYCGIRCYQASQRTTFPASTIPAPAATNPTPAATDGSQDSFKLRTERANGPVARKSRSTITLIVFQICADDPRTTAPQLVLLMLQDLWQSDTARTPQLRSIYRIDLPVEMYRRFDLAL
ncbi:hypothetical protein FRC00_002558 [Tulasnella sp. 408]|nr:hypothetical protein FRC00_002558 [Tulasnella sp. 408]